MTNFVQSFKYRYNAPHVHMSLQGIKQDITESTDNYLERAERQALVEIVILWVYFTIPFGFSFFRHFWDIIFQPFQLLSLAKDH